MILKKGDKIIVKCPNLYEPLDSALKNKRGVIESNWYNDQVTARISISEDKERSVILKENWLIKITPLEEEIDRHEKR